MHFLGLAGLPRRVPDYPSGYEYWNSIMTYGSILTFLSLILLFYLIFSTLISPSLSSIHSNKRFIKF
jgi:heme/copper-type cytochrome/quinol oxidase subunit 1